MALTITTDTNGYDEPIWQVRDTSTTPSTVLKTFLDPEEACIWLCELEDDGVEDFNVWLKGQYDEVDATYDETMSQLEQLEVLEKSPLLSRSPKVSWFGEVISKAKPGDDDYVVPGFDDEVPF